MDKVIPSEWANHWYSLGYTFVPANQKVPLIKFADVRASLTPEKSLSLLNVHPKATMIMALTDNKLFVVDADSNESYKALLEIESMFNMNSKLIVKTRKGYQHHYLLPDNYNLVKDTHSTEQHPSKLDLITGKSLVALPPSLTSDEKRYELIKCEIDHISKLSVASPEFIYALYNHNGSKIRFTSILEQNLPLPPPIEKVICPKELALDKEIISYISPELGYQEWIEVGMAIQSKYGDAPEGFELFNEYSAKGASYEGYKKTKTQYDAFKSNKGISFGTIKKLAKLAGANLNAIHLKHFPFQPVTAMIDYKNPLPNLNGNGKPLKTYENLSEILKRIDIKVVHNVIKKETQISYKGHSNSYNHSNSALISYIKSECAKFNYPTSMVEEFLAKMALDNTYNPVIEYIESKKWDGKSRLKKLFETLKVEGDKELAYSLLIKWMLTAVKAAYSENGLAAQGVLVFQGKQGIGKTRWFTRLIPTELELTIESMILKPDDKDSIKKAVSYWAVELGELDATFKKAEIASLKAFLTAKQDVFRLPYARAESKFPRQTVFFASVNPKTYLNDTTGNRRYWTIECLDINADHSIDMQQVWAELKNILDKDPSCYLLTRDEENKLNTHNSFYQSICPIEELLNEHLDWEQPKDKWVKLTISQLLKKLGVEPIRRTHTIQVSQYLNDKGSNEIRSNGQRLRLIPSPKIFIH